MQVSTSCSLTRISPASKQNLGIKTSLVGESRKKAINEHALVRSSATFVGEVEFERQQILQAVFGEHRVHSQQTAEAGSQLSRKLFFDAVNRVSVDDRGECVELGTRTQFAASSRGWESTYEIDTLDVE